MRSTQRGPSEAELLAALPVAVLVVDPEDRVERANAEAETLLNLSERAMRGQTVAELLGVADAEARRANHAFAAFDIEVETRGGARVPERSARQGPGSRRRGRIAPVRGGPDGGGNAPSPTRY